VAVRVHDDERWRAIAPLQVMEAHTVDVDEVAACFLAHLIALLAKVAD
jgi:hypothetical protein